MFAAVKMLSDSSEIQRNIMEKQIYSTTISPNQSVHGFIYTSIDPANPLATGIF